MLNRWPMAILLMMFLGEVSAQTVDVSLSGSISPTGIQYQGTIATVTLVFANVGTVPTTVTSARSNSLPVFSNEAVVPGPYGDSPCTMYVDSFHAPPGSGGQSTIRFQVEAGPLAVGQSRTCTFGLAVRSTNLVPFTLRMEAFGFANGTVESNRTDNFFVLPLEFGGPQPIPAAEPGALLLLLWSIFLAALAVSRADAARGKY